MKAITIALTAAVLIAAGIIAAENFGGTEPSAAGGLGLALKEATQDGIHQGSAGTASVSAKRAKVPKVIYWSSKYYKLGPQATSSFWMQCPKGSKPVEGFFYANRPGVVLGSSFPAKRAKVQASKKPRWNFGVLNFNTSETAKYYTGVTCMKGVRG